MIFSSWKNENGLMTKFAINDQVYENKEFLFRENDNIFYYDRLYENLYGKNCFDLKDFLVFYKLIDKFEFDLSNCWNILSNWLGTYNKIKFDISSLSLEDVIPPTIIKNFLLNRNVILLEAYEAIQHLPDFERFVEAYRNNKHLFDIQGRLQYDIKTSSGQKSVLLDFAQNFRFKSRKEYFNLLNLPKEQRNIIIPQEENHFLYVIDFKQFEFRTFLSLSETNEIDFAEPDIYKNISKLINKTREETKIYCLSAIYNETKNNIPFLNKQNILNKIQGNVFKFNEWPIYINPEFADNKKIHTIIQTISQFYYLDVLDKTLNLLKDKNSRFIFPLHDSIIISLSEQELYLVDDIKKILENDIYKIKQYVGLDLANLEEM